jgi:dipeptidyl aminopeptidase/acylaminoacyl peptidase
MKKRITAESIFDIYNIESPVVSPDGSLVAFVRSRPSETVDDYEKSIWLTDTAGKEAPVRFISTGLKNYSPAWSPDGRKLCFVSNRDGSPQLYEIPTSGGEARKLTSMVGAVATPSYSPDGKRIVFNCDSTIEEHACEDEGVLYGDITGEYAKKWAQSHRDTLKDPRVIKKLPYKTGTSFFDGRYSHLYCYECESSRIKRLSNGNYHHSSGQWSADSSRVLANSNRDQNSGDEYFELWSSILAFDVKTAKMSVVAEEVCEEGRPPKISPDGKWVAFFYVPKSPSPYQLPYYVAVAPVKGGEIKRITSDDMTVADFQWDSDGAHILVNLHWHGDAVVQRININDPEGDIRTVLDGKRFVTDVQVSNDGAVLAYNVTTPVKPSDLFVYFRQQNREVQLTFFNAEWQKEHFLSPYNEIDYTAPDGTQLQGWYCKPMNFEPSQSYPLAVEIHGVGIELYA